MRAAVATDFGGNVFTRSAVARRFSVIQTVLQQILGRSLQDKYLLHVRLRNNVPYMVDGFEYRNGTGSTMYCEGNGVH